MQYTIYKMEFTTGVHLGKTTLSSAEMTLHADTLFSAMCHEAVKMGKKTFEKLYLLAKQGKLLFSDGFPYMESCYYIPKPLKKIEIPIGKEINAGKKGWKKLRYIPMEKLESYLLGTLDPEIEGEKFKNIGKKILRTSASIRGEMETKPYNIGVYYFEKGNGIYFIMGFEHHDVRDFAEELLEALSYSGIGGKRSSGMGKFILKPGKFPKGMEERILNPQRELMSLSVSMAGETELEEALKGAEYLLEKRGGFVSSEQYAQEQMKKRDLYVFQSGSCFQKRFEGDIFDVSVQGKHPVYRYAKPLFMGVDI